MVMRRRVSGCWLLVALGASGAHAVEQRAEEVRVISAQPDSVSVTIYRDLFALITETRSVDLPAGPVTLVFEGVVDTLLPQSAMVTDTKRSIAEANYDFDRLTPANLLRKSIGRSVTLTRTNPATGRARQLAATVVAANPRGIVFQTAEGHEALFCSGLPEQLTFEEIPGELKSKPQLSIRLAAGEPGPRQVRVSYLAHGFAWQANYVAHLGERMDLLGWITLDNFTGSTFRDASVQVVAGRLNLLDTEDDLGTGPLGATADYGPDEYVEEERDAFMQELREERDEEPEDVEYFFGCYPMGFPKRATAAFDVGKFPDSNIAAALQRAAGGEELEEVIVTGLRGSMAARERLADYQLYRLPERTDLLARQTKQVAFLHKPEARYERFYAVRFEGMHDYEEAMEGPMPARVRTAWINRESDGLGEPLPSGRVRFFENGPAGPIFIGDDRLPDTSVGAPAEFFLGMANDVAVTIENEKDAQDEPPFSLMGLLTRRVYLPLNLRVISDKGMPVPFEVRQGPIEEIGDFRVKNASLPTQRKAGDYLWRFTVPANGDATLTYKVGGRLPDDF
jgi:hypothetical protein